MTEFIKFLNSLGFGAVAAILSAITAVVAGGISVYKTCKSVSKIWKDFVKKREERQEAKEKLSNNVNMILVKMSGLESTVANLQERTEQTSNDTNKKIDELWNTLTEGQKNSNNQDMVLSKHITDTSNRVNDISELMETLNDKTTLLIKSNKDSIKSEITDKYYRALKEGYIEAQVLENLEKSYDIYIQENGNTYVSTVMNKLRELPNKAPDNMPTNRENADDEKPKDL